MPSKTPAVSIVIPVYNADPTYLQQCLESVQAQDCNNVEVIVVDDGSTDTGTVRMCESFSNVFTVLHQSNQGVAAARNNGIAHASGEWVAFIDADDWIAPTFLSRLAELGRRSDADIVICDCMVERGSHSAMNHFFPEHSAFAWNDETRVRTLLQIFGKNKYYNPPYIAVGVPWAKLYRTQFLRDHDLHFPVGMSRMEDNIFNLYAVQAAARVAYLPQALYHYRVVEGSSSREYSPDILQTFTRVNNETKVFLDTFSHDKRLDQAFYARVIQSVHSYMLFWIFHTQNPQTYRDKKRELLRIISSEPYNEALCQLDYASAAKSIAVFAVLLKFHCCLALDGAINIERIRR